MSLLLSSSLRAFLSSLQRLEKVFLGSAVIIAVVTKLSKAESLPSLGVKLLGLRKNGGAALPSLGVKLLGLRKNGGDGHRARCLFRHRRRILLDGGHV